MIPQNHPDARLSHFLQTFGFTRILRAAGIHKQTVGISPVVIIQFLLGLIFTQRNFWRWLATRKPPEIPFGKDIPYHFLNDPLWNWREVLSRVGHLRKLSNGSEH